MGSPGRSPEGILQTFLFSLFSTDWLDLSRALGFLFHLQNRAELWFTYSTSCHSAWRRSSWPLRSLFGCMTWWNRILFPCNQLLLTGTLFWGWEKAKQRHASHWMQLMGSDLRNLLQHPNKAAIQCRWPWKRGWDREDEEKKWRMKKERCCSHICAKDQTAV